MAGRDLSDALESRCLVHPRQAEHDKAIFDFDAALAAHPKDAMDLYGRGLAERAKGLNATPYWSRGRAARAMSSPSDTDARGLFRHAAEKPA